MTLRNQTISGVRWTTFSSLGRAALQFLQIVILARLLAPSDFGLIALVVAIMAILQIFSDGGISNAIIHYQVISHEQLSSLYWLNVGVSVFLAFVVAVTSYRVADWYHQPALRYLLLLAAVTLVVGALGQQIRVLAEKKLRFADLAKVELTAAIAGFSVAVSLAVLGERAYALAVGSLITASVSCVMVWVRLSEGWRPQMRFQLTEIRQFLKFGSYMVGNNLANTLNSQIDILLGGRLLGMQSIGIYSMPKDLALRIGTVINPIVTQVGLPVMAKAQNELVLLKKIYLQIMLMTASVNFPIYVFIGIFAPEIVTLLLGPQWENTTALLRIFASWALLRSIGNPAGSLLMAQGRADLSFKWNLALLMGIPPVVWYGSLFGVEGLAVAMMLLGLLTFWPNWYFLIRPLCGAEFGEYIAQLAAPLALSIVAGLVGYLGADLWETSLLRLTIGIAVGSSVYIFLSYLFNRVWFMAMMELLGIRK